jgi:hypothetical protein
VVCDDRGAGQQKGSEMFGVHGVLSRPQYGVAALVRPIAKFVAKSVGLLVQPVKHPGYGPRAAPLRTLSGWDRDYLQNKRREE